MPLGEHLDELRRRVLRAVIAVVAAFVLCFAFSGTILGLFTGPTHAALAELGLIPKTHTIRATFFSGFSAILNVSFVGAVALASPFVLWQLWAFICSGLFPNERRIIRLLFPISVLLFLAGLVFAYFVLLPIGIRFLLSIGGDQSEPYIYLQDCISFFLWMAILIGASFECPILLYGLARTGVLTAADLAGKRRIAILGIIILSAVATPSPDAVTMLLLAGPLYLLYEVGILWIRIGDPSTPAADRRRARRIAFTVPAALALLAAGATAFGPGALDALRESRARQGLQSKDPSKRSEAIRRLAAFPGSRFQSEIASALEDADARVRLEAARALARSKTFKALRVLVDLLKSPEAYADAKKALEEATGESVERDIVRERWEEWLERKRKP